MDTEHDRAPFFSVCMPTYNYAHYIGEAIESVLAQDFADWELIICDDQSTDDTEAVVGKFNDPRVTYIRNDERLGIFGNLNKSMRLSRGRYLKTLCADDALSPACLGVVHRNVLARDPWPDVVNVRMVEDPALLERRVEGLGACRPCDPRVLMGMICRGEDVYWNLPSFCVRRDYFEEFGYYRSRGKDRDYALDVIVALTTLARGPSVLVDSPLVFARRHGKNASVRLGRRIVTEEILAFVRENRELFEGLPDGPRAMAAMVDDTVSNEMKDGFTLLLTRGDPRYLLDTVRAARRSGARRIPWGMAARKATRAALGRLTGRRP